MAAGSQRLSSGTRSVSAAYCDSYELSRVKDALEEMFASLGYDENNPLGSIVKPGMKVFIKPNWVASRWRESCSHKDDLYCIITHPSVIEAVADYVAVALNGEGSIVIGDNPSIDADFDELMETIKIDHLKQKYNIPLDIVDLRPLVCEDLSVYGKKGKMISHIGDSLGEEVVNLGNSSLLYDVNPRLFRGVFDERGETIAAHTGDTQLYGFSKSIYDADVFISIPKMKTHHKVGVTLNLKGTVGAITEKNHLVHWRLGFPAIGGDEYPSFLTWFKSKFQNVKERGAWNGNDTIWRMVVDLYHALHLKERGYFSVVDGIVGGEGKGPFCAHSKHSNTLVCGDDFLSVDLASVMLMGFDPAKIPYLSYFINNEIKLEDIALHMPGKIAQNLSDQMDVNLDYFPAQHWSNLRPDGRWK